MADFTLINKKYRWLAPTVSIPTPWRTVRTRSRNLFSSCFPPTSPPPGLRTCPTLPLALGPAVPGGDQGRGPRARTQPRGSAEQAALGTYSRAGRDWAQAWLTGIARQLCKYAGQHFNTRRVHFQCLPQNSPDYEKKIKKTCSEMAETCCNHL